MTTKAQAFRAQQERAAQSSKPKAKAKKATPTRTRRTTAAQPAAQDEGAEATTAEPLNESMHAGRRGGATLEASATSRPSRKSTRKSVDHTKRTTNQQLKAVRATTSPSARARRGA